MEAYMEQNNPARHTDSRDARTQAGDTAHPTEARDTPDEIMVQAPADDPVNAVDPTASPSRYTQRDIDSGNTPLDEEMEMLIDPSIGRERLSTNPDVLDLDDSWRVESEEPDFMDDPGTTDMIEAVEEAEPYFPPTDPPLTIRGANDAAVLGGFSATSLEEDDPGEEDPLRVQGGDDEIAERVRYALAVDGYTSDLNIEVEVQDGVVYLHGQVRSLEDIEQAEQVAGSVEGVDDVEEDLEIV
jgi:BON domain